MTGELLLGPLSDAPAEISPGLGTDAPASPHHHPNSDEIIEIVSRFLLQRPGARSFAFQQNRVPDELNFSTRLGNIVAVEVNDATVSTGAGEIVVGRAFGDLKATTRGGPINIGETFAALEVETEAGDILINSANKGGYARTGGGNIRVRSATGTLRLVSGGGDITVEQAAENVTAHTQSGDVTIEVPQGVQRLSLDLETTGGNVILTLPQGLRANVDATVITSDAGINTIDSTVSGLAVVRDMVGGKSRIRATGSLNGGGPNAEDRREGRQHPASAIPLEIVESLPLQPTNSNQRVNYETISAHLTPSPRRMRQSQSIPSLSTVRHRCHRNRPPSTKP